jgi:DNA-binding SARP family transcriptional activator
VVADPEWRRERVRSLLLYLVAHPRATREQITDALWPELDIEAGLSNVRVTLGYLHKVLEPRRAAGASTYVVAALGDLLVLRQDALTVDAWEFAAAIEQARRFDADGSSSLAMQSYRQAVELWGGDYFADMYDDWAGPERDRLRSDFLTAAIRYGELLLASGEIERALELGTRAIEAERWFEPGYRLVIAAHLARRDRASAHRALTRCYAALDELGAQPDEETAVFERRILTS